MSKPKYMKGDCIRSLDDLVLQENIFWNGRIWNRKWFMNLRNGGYMIDAKEIVQALRCCAEGECKDCAMHEDKQRCQENLLDKASEAIERLTAENAKAEAERDAAIVDLKIFAGCSACRHCCNHRRDHQESLLLTCCDCTKKQNCKCGSCSLGRSNWEWHELPEAPEGNNAT